MSEQPKDRRSGGGIYDDIETDYANNIAFENTAWDLKVIFGEYSDRLKATEWHTSITVPWAQAKLMLYYLKLNVDAYESEHGKIHIPPRAIPPDASQIPDDPKDAGLKNVKSIIERNRKQFLESL